MIKAYTVGHTANYDEALSEIQNEMPRLRKIGKQQPSDDNPEGYDGGIVWETPEEAREWLELNPFRRYSIYEIELTDTYNVCTYKHNDGSYRLINDAFIIGKFC